MNRAFVVAALIAAAVLPAAADSLDVAAGKALFEKNWVSAPSSTTASDGLGPLFNARACASCHREGGPTRASRSEGKWAVRGGVVRIGSSTGEPDPFYGRQLQNRSLRGLSAEARINILFEVIPGAETAGALGRARAEIDLQGPPPDPRSLTEVLVAPSLTGRGMIEAVDASAVLSLADPNDRNRDGVSGKARLIKVPDGQPALGRFGYKASQATLDGQVAEAAAIDIGLSSPLAIDPHGDCSVEQADCRRFASGDASPGGPQLSAEAARLIASYVASLDRASLPSNHGGRDLLAELGCASCHVPHLPDREGRKVHIFSDLLLHDMGAGLSGLIGAPGVSPAEWRTAPLVDLNPREGTRRYLHDGRASSIDEAIRWHGGEADAARTRYQSLPAELQARLIDYLEQL